MPRNPYEPPREESREAKRTEPQPTRRLFGMTLIEAIVVVLILTGLTVVFWPALTAVPRQKPPD